MELIPVNESIDHKKLQSVWEKPKQKSFKIEYAGDVATNKDLEKLPTLWVNPNKESGTFGSFFKGWTKTFDNLASGVNWVGEKATGAIGWDSAKNFFHQNRTWWNGQAKLNDIETEKHKTAHFVGELLNPTLLMPAGVFTKGKLAIDLAKSAGAGALINGGEQALEVAGRQDLTNKQKLNRVAFASTIGAIGNGIFVPIIKKIEGKAPEVMAQLDEAYKKGDTTKVKEVLQTIKSNPEAFGITPNEAKKFEMIAYEKPIEPELIDEKPPIEMYPNYDNAVLPNNKNGMKLIPVSEKEINDIDENKLLPVYQSGKVEPKLVENLSPEPVDHPQEIKNLMDWSDKFANNYDKLTLEELKQHPYFEHIINSLKDVSAKDKRYPQKLVSKRYYNQYEGREDPALYEPNYHFEYKLSKAPIQRILKGKPTAKDLEKLKEDLQYETERILHDYKNNPELYLKNGVDENELKAQIMHALDKKDYDTIEELLPQIKDEEFVSDVANKLSVEPDERAGSIAGQYLFANANQRLAGGMLGGTYNAIENPDQNNDGYVTDEERALAFLKGFGIGALSPEALKILQKTSPKTYEKIMSLAKTETNGQPVAGAFFNGAKKDVENVAENAGKDTYKYLSDYVENNAKHRGWGDVSKGWFGDVQRLFTNTRSGEYMRVFKEMNIEKNKYNAKLENLFKVLNEMPTQAKADLIDYIENVKKDYPQEIKELGEHIKNTIGQIQQELKDAGFPPEYIDKYGVNYVARLYKDKLGVKRLSDVLKQATKGIYQQKGVRGKSVVVSEDELQKMIESGELDPAKEGEKFINGGWEKIPIANKEGYYKIRRDWTPEERERMGQIKDADIVIPLTLMRLQSMKAMKDFFEKVKGINGAIIDPKEFMEKAGIKDPAKIDAELKEQGFEKLPKNEAYGALSGKYVRRDIADDIHYLKKQVFEPSVLEDMWRKYLTAWKKSKTVYNTSAHFNNFMNNIALAWYAGMPIHQIPKYFANAFKDLRKAKQLDELEMKLYKGIATEDDLQKLSKLKNELKYLNEAKEVGLLDTSMVRDILSYGGIEDSAENLIGGKGILGKTAKFANDMYQGEDNVAKLAMYKVLREKGYSPQKAREMVTVFMPDYSEPLPIGWRALRDTGFAPFISWTYYVVPHLIKYTLKGGINSPATRKMLALIATIEGLQYLLTNGKVDLFADLNPFDETKPTNTKFIRMGIGEHNGVIDTLKIDRLIPQTMLLPTQWVGQFKQTFSGVTPSLWSAFMFGAKAYNGRPVTYESRPVARQGYDWLKYLVESYAPVPATATQAWDTFADPYVKKALYPNQKKRGVQLYLDRTPTQNWLKLLTGVNTLSYDQKELKREIQRKKNRK